MCPVGDSGAQIARGLNWLGDAVRLLLSHLYSESETPDPTLLIKERNRQIIERYNAGESQADLARAFKISYQRIHQIIHRSKKPRK